MPEITETKLKEQIAKEQIGSLYFLYGDEKLLVRRNLNRLLKKLDGNFPEFNFQEFPHDAPVDQHCGRRCRHAVYGRTQVRHGLRPQRGSHEHRGAR